MNNSNNATEKFSIGFIGLGRMGGPMAQRILARYPGLTVYDPNPQAMEQLTRKGARGATSAAELASKATLVFASLPTPDIVRRVALGSDGITNGSVEVFVDLSTTGSKVESEVAESLLARGIKAIDCPVSGGLTGGISGATEGTMALIVAGQKEIVDEISPILSIMGKVFYVGTKPGMAQTVKLVNNLLSFAAIAITSEVMSISAKAGLDSKQVIDIINAGSGRNSATLNKFPQAVLTRTFDFGFPVNLTIKDIKLALQEAERYGVPTILGRSVLDLFEITQCRFGPDVDMTSLVRTFEEWTGTEVR